MPQKISAVNFLTTKTGRLKSLVCECCSDPTFTPIEHHQISRSWNITPWLAMPMVFFCVFHRSKSFLTFRCISRTRSNAKTKNTYASSLHNFPHLALTARPYRARAQVAKSSPYFDTARIRSFRTIFSGIYLWTGPYPRFMAEAGVTTTMSRMGKSLTLFVTRVYPYSFACAAIKQSRSCMRTRLGECAR